MATSKKLCPNIVLLLRNRWKNFETVSLSGPENKPTNLTLIAAGFHRMDTGKGDDRDRAEEYNNRQVLWVKYRVDDANKNSRKREKES